MIEILVSGSFLKLHQELPTRSKSLTGQREMQGIQQQRIRRHEKKWDL
jgi:hypothetical protein